MFKKSKNDRVLFGVCGGIAKTLGIDSPLIRIAFILGTIFTGSLLLWIYLLLGIVLPIDE
jgi:phage shock protein PspC (stress-responsive transcriptional regulator)